MIVRCSHCGRQLVVPGADDGRLPRLRRTGFLRQRGRRRTTRTCSPQRPEPVKQPWPNRRRQPLARARNWEAEAAALYYANGAAANPTRRRWNRFGRPGSFAVEARTAQLLGAAAAGAVVTALLAVGIWYSVRQNPALADLGQRRWMYLQRSTAGELLPNELDKQSGQGWELVSAERTDGNKYELIFKRPAALIPAAVPEPAVIVAPAEEAAAAKAAESAVDEPPKLKTDLRRFEQDFNSPKARKNSGG